MSNFRINNILRNMFFKKYLIYFKLMILEKKNEKEKEKERRQQSNLKMNRMDLIYRNWSLLVTKSPLATDILEFQNKSYHRRKVRKEQVIPRYFNFKNAVIFFCHLVK